MRGDILYTRLCQMLGIQYPIVQAGMGWVSRAELAAAVSNAGALGFLAGSQLTPDELRDEIRKTKQLTDKPFGVDILFATVPKTGERAAEEFTQVVKDQIEVAFAEGVPVIASGLGNPGPIVPEAHRRGMVVMALVGNVRNAKQVEASGVDIIVAQGHEAGGHTGRITTMVLVPAVVDAAKVPVLAAGGIGDGRGLLAALMLGAQGVWVGTRFVATHEAFSHINYKLRIAQISEEDTVVTRCWTGKPARVIRNRTTDEWEKKPSEILPFPLQWARMQDVFPLARRDGNTEVGHMAAGQVSGLIREIKSAAEVVEEMMAEARQILAEKMPQLVS